ncbi:MAG: acyl-CoA carboxylase subunit beta [Akkermansiaceae bacterium]|nr:acyl-CoA carboxylase subunit beta [Akkermansiaceae bacterium]MCP5542566.1 acyl-CoA carboxylase subunit beta [Akkermansiaceae bacterium]MCP5547894.1 acyl-CoA carboxylase subunit beta [Akkermansiaceae bacterium]
MAIDRSLLEGLEQRRKEALVGGGIDRIEKRHEKGLLSARERLAAFFDDGQFIEFGMHAHHSCSNFGLEKRKMPGDGVVCATGAVDGRQVAAFAQDFTVGGGAVGRIHAKKICDLLDFAVKAGMPVIGINDSGGARIQEGIDALSGYGQVFFRNVLLSGVVPQISIIAGPCAGGAAYSPALTDFIIMTRKNANMFICGPDVIKAATGQSASLDQFASADAHAQVSGNIHLIAEDDEHAIELAKRLLDYLPSNNLGDPPHDIRDEITVVPDPKLNEILPEDPKAPLDMAKVIDCLVDPGSWFEIQPDFAPNMLTGFARLEGMVIGIIANQPTVKAGCIDIDASDKAARFIRVCNIYSIPVLSLVDVPGFMPGLAQERGGIIRHGAKMLFAWASGTVPKITLICRKAYGGAYLAMCSSDMGADFVFAWPTAEIAVMGAQGAMKVLYKKELSEAEDPEALEKELRKAYSEKFASPYQAASNGMITDVIDPALSRSTLALAFRGIMGKHETRPPKKHGNIPL